MRSPLVGVFACALAFASVSASASAGSDVVVVAPPKYLFTDGPFSAYWYVPAVLNNSTLRVVFEVDFAKATSGTKTPTGQWIGVGFQVASGNKTVAAMGPAQFYTGQVGCLWSYLLCLLAQRWL